MQSITRNPLFPAVVALWFGALFGLGSLVIRTSLIEAIVVKFQLDAIVASLAPPLGATTRIMLALLMAGIGGFLGAVLARRIARVKPVARERTRNANKERAAHKRKLSPQRAVVSEDEDDEEIEEKAPTGRRRALTMQDEGAYDPDLDAHAPLPGGSPQILDVSEFDLEGFESEAETMTDEPEALAAPDYDAGKTDMDSLNYNPFEPDSSSDGDEGPPEGAQVFEPDPGFGGFGKAQPSFEEAPATPAETAQDSNPFAAPAGDFTEPVRAQAYAPQPEEQPVEDTPLPRFDMMAQAPQPATTQRPSVFDNQPPEAPLFQRPAASVVPQPDDEAPVGESTPALQDTAPPAFDAPQDNPFAAPAAGNGTGFGQPVAADEDIWGNDDEDDDQDSEEVVGNFASLSSHRPAPREQSEAAAFAPPAEPVAQVASEPPVQAAPAPAPEPVESATAAERISDAELGDLSHVELLERLALSLKRRREAPTEEPAAPTVVPATAPEPEPQAVEPEAPAPFAAPEAQDFSAPLDQPTAEPAPSIPAAMRPIGLDSADDGDDLLPSYVPPRHIGAMPGAPAAQPEESAPQEEPRAFDAPTPAAQPAPAAPQIPQAYEPEAPAFAAPSPMPSAYEPGESGEAKAATDNDEARVLEEGYSSLLNLSRPAGERSEFVRIEEPEALGEEIEPVVVFPGQEAGQRGSFGAAAAAAHAEQRFDAPAPEPVPSSGEGQSEQDAAESERALRAALATLQRMSGAA
ncbi:MAG: hypothetical protein R3D89_00020 [Sphingomonadaceae bacterium]